MTNHKGQSSGSLGLNLVFVDFIQNEEVRQCRSSCQEDIYGF